MPALIVRLSLCGVVHPIWPNRQLEDHAGGLFYARVGIVLEHDALHELHDVRVLGRVRDAVNLRTVDRF